jgi:beta-glucanase (GH16 family)
VQAHASETIFASQTKSVSIQLPDDGGNGDGGGETSDAGYTSPESYEGMHLVWRDEFEGNRLNTDDWTFETGTGSDGWGNAELQYYREENTSVQDGYLKITAKEESHGGRNYTSSRIKTQGKQSFQYGRIDIRAKMPEGQGIWPALWMLGSNFPTAGWPACGEIDIMEMIGGAGRENTVHGTIHWSHEGSHAYYGNGHTLNEGTLADQFHVFSIVWDESNITWYIDDIEFNVVDITPAELSEFHQEFFFIFNVAVGGRWPGSPDSNTSFPQSMLVDYVRVFQVD